MPKHLLQQRPSLSEHLIADVGGSHTFDGSAYGPEGTVSCLVKRVGFGQSIFKKGLLRFKLSPVFQLIMKPVESRWNFQ
ncbi:hypothetical protein CEXT_183901 [Caerostris extrusa]|uniref:Uncharacterized protein n=1 Tax=Caerostris extrusa TaxID=172846 RepID=A0AAV4PPA8_CAEEX|nr:hypothetical protein CEXT_183901 [Caerostris extrusa]